MSEEIVDHLASDLEGNVNTVPNASEEENNPEQREKPLSKKEERELKLAYARAIKQRADAVKRNKELVADKQLEVAYWKAEADLLRYRFEKMDFFIKNLEIEPRYLQAKESLEARESENLVENNKVTLD